MKTFLRIAISACILLYFSFSGHTETKKDPRKSNGTNPKGITYLVEIDAANIIGLCHSYRIIIRDENGVIIDEPKLFHEGIVKYVFHEMGPVSGKRIAHMEQIPNSAPNVCSQALYSTPHIHSNTFRNGATYLFQLSPVVLPVNSQ